jgi:hypothetical protein
LAVEDHRSTRKKVIAKRNTKGNYLSSLPPNRFCGMPLGLCIRSVHQILRERAQFTMCGPRNVLQVEQVESRV